MRTPSVFSMLLAVVAAVPLLAAAGCNALTGSERSLDDELGGRSHRFYYRSDAARLALRDVSQDRPYDQIHIPEALSEHYFDALAAVYLQADDEQWGDLWDIHTVGDVAIHSLTVTADSSEAWIDTFEASETQTGVDSIDAFLDRYGFMFGEYRGGRNSDQLDVIFYSEERYNMAALVPFARELPGVLDASVHTSSHGRCGDDITGRIDGEEVELTFETGGERDFKVCYNRRFWTYRVDAAGTARLVETGTRSL